MFRKLLIKKENITTLALLLLCTLILWHFGAVVYAGVGGGVEAREKVDIVPLIKWTLVFPGRACCCIWPWSCLCSKEIRCPG